MTERRSPPARHLAEVTESLLDSLRLGDLTAAYRLTLERGRVIAALLELEGLTPAELDLIRRAIRAGEEALAESNSQAGRIRRELNETDRGRTTLAAYRPPQVRGGAGWDVRR